MWYCSWLLKGKRSGITHRHMYIYIYISLSLYGGALSRSRSLSLSLSLSLSRSLAVSLSRSLALALRPTGTVNQTSEAKIADATPRALLHGSGHFTITPSRHEMVKIVCCPQRIALPLCDPNWQMSPPQ